MSYEGATSVASTLGAKRAATRYWPRRQRRRRRRTTEQAAASGGCGVPSERSPSRGRDRAAVGGGGTRFRGIAIARLALRVILLSPWRSCDAASAGRSLSRIAIVPRPGAARATGLPVWAGCWFAGRIQRRQSCGDVDAVSPKRKRATSGSARRRGLRDRRVDGRHASGQADELRAGAVVRLVVCCGGRLWRLRMLDRWCLRLCAE
jgi:hypothetical protein